MSPLEKDRLLVTTWCDGGVCGDWWEGVCAVNGDTWYNWDSAWCCAIASAERPPGARLGSPEAFDTRGRPMPNRWAEAASGASEGEACWPYGLAGLSGGRGWNV